MSVTTIDNFVSPEFVKGLRSTIMLDRKHSFNMSSVGIFPFYSVDFDIKEPIVDNILIKINKALNTSYIAKRVYANIQYSGMDGTWHTDDGDVTALLFLNEPLEGGNFEIRLQKEEKQIIEPLPGRLVVFEGKNLHRGLSSSTLAIPRISLAFKLWNKI